MSRPALAAVTGALFLAGMAWGGGHAMAQSRDAIAGYVGPILAEAKPAATIEIKDDAVKLVYGADRWATDYDLLRVSLFKHVIAIVPLIFAKEPGINTIELVASATAVDARGNDSRILAGYFKFSRKNAATINWPRVDPYADDDVRKIADIGVLHPKAQKFK